MLHESSKKQHRPATPLVSRHVFLDTQVYRALGHNPANRAMTLLKEQVTSHRVVLHTTDITLLEVKRQIRERVLERQRELKIVERDLTSWRKLAPNAMPEKATEFDAEVVSTELFHQFELFLLRECKSEVHSALAVAPAVVFEKYFDRRPPFDGEGSKEFPDGFVLEVLGKWCREHGETMNLITEDKAMTRAASASEYLLPLKDIHEVLVRAAADLGADGEQAAEAVFGAPAFDSSLLEALRVQMKQIGYIYIGDLVEGEAYEGKLLGIVEVGDWSVVALSDQRVTIILDARVSVLVEVQYENRDHASYDREDGIWIHSEISSAEVEDEVDIVVLLDVERHTCLVREAKILTEEVSVQGESEWE